MSYTLTNNNTVKFPPVGPSATVATFDQKAIRERLAHTNFAPDWGWGMTSAWWMRTTSAATAGEWYHVIGQYGPIWGGGGLMINDGNSSAGLLSMTLSNPSETPSTTWVETVNDGLWHFIVMRYDPSTFKADLSVDLAAPVFTTALVNGHPQVAPLYKLLYYGSCGFIGDFGFQGDMCRAGIWNYYMRDAALQHLYNRGRGRTYADLSSDLNSTSANNRLLAYYNMDESSGSRTDSSGNGYTLSVEGDSVDSTTYTVPSQIPGQAAGFLPGRSEYLSHASLFNALDGTFDYTVVCWIFHPETSLATARPIFNFGSFNAGPMVYLQASGSESNCAINQLPSGQVTLGDCRSKWLMVVTQYQSSDVTLRTAVFGSPSNSGVWTSRVVLLAPKCTTFEIGHHAQLAHFFLGQINSFVVFNKQLSGDEISALYNSGNGYRPFWGVSISPSFSVSPSASGSPSASASPSHSLSPSNSQSPSASVSPSSSPSPSA